MEQLEQPVVRPELAKRRDRGVIETGVSCFDQPAQLIVVQIVSDERRQHARRDLLIGGALQRLELVPLDPRPRIRQIQPAIGREAGEQRRLEATRRHAAAGADVAKTRRAQ